MLKSADGLNFALYVPLRARRRAVSVVTVEPSATEGEKAFRIEESTLTAPVVARGIPTVTPPATSSLLRGLVVPMPTFPVEPMRRRSAPLVTRPRTSVAG